MPTFIVPPSTLPVARTIPGIVVSDRTEGLNGWTLVSVPPFQAEKVRQLGGREWTEEEDE